MFEFSQKAFFRWGMFCFLIIGLAQLWGYVLDFQHLFLWAKIARAGTTIFNFVVAYFFLWLSKNTPEAQQNPYYQMSDEELKDFLKKEKKNNGV